MKILIVSNQYNKSNKQCNPVIYRFLNSLNRNKNIETASFVPFTNKLIDYINIRNNAKNYDIIHVHFGGIYALILYLFIFDLHIKKIITFHGTDIHAKAIKSTRSILKKIKIRLNQISSFISIFLYDKVGFVAESMIDYVPQFISKNNKKKYFIQKLGVDYNLFKIENKEFAIKKLGLEMKKYALFSDIGNSPIKRRDIAYSIISHLPEYELLIMCKVSPEEVPNYINAADFLILTSDEEGSPNIIRECLSLNTPVFSVNVGDAAEQISGLKKSAIISRIPNEASAIIRKKLNIYGYEDSRKIKREFIDIDILTSKMVSLYKETLNLNNFSESH